MAEEMNVNIEQSAFNHVAMTLARHFDSLYYIEIATGKYVEFVPARMLGDLKIPKQGEDFFAMSQKNASQYVHPDDLERILRIHDKKVILDNLMKSDSYTTICRLIVDGKIIHIRHIAIMCEDNEHIICSMENIEDEYQEKEEQKKNLQSAERMARRDELTGIKNKNAFAEQSQIIADKIKAGTQNTPFGIVICDVNDLKLLNDTRGHSFGDEAIQRACRMICNVFKHSPVFRIGGDEFAVILSGSDYEQREELLTMLREESISNGRTKSGPVVASGLAVYDPEMKDDFSNIFERADQRMYDDKKELKSMKYTEEHTVSEMVGAPVPDERRRMLDRLFGALVTVADDGYVFLNDMRYDYSRWSLSLLDDFGLTSEYMYHAGKIWQEYIHPDDLETYREAEDSVFLNGTKIRPFSYRARRADGTYIALKSRWFVLPDSQGKPEYFGGIIVPQ